MHTHQPLNQNTQPRNNPGIHTNAVCYEASVGKGKLICQIWSGGNC